MIPAITMGKSPLGLRWAVCGKWRVQAYALDGYMVQTQRRLADGTLRAGWFLSAEAPLAVERLLCAALGIPCKR
jgi:hypothetical protein